MTPGEQQALQYLYGKQLGNVFLLRVLSVLRFKTGIYINEPGLRYALLALSAADRGDFRQREAYRSLFWSVMGNVNRSNIVLDHMIAFGVMLLTTLTEVPDEVHECLREVVKITSDLAGGRIHFDFSSFGVELDVFIDTFRSMVGTIPINVLDERSLAPSHFDSFEIPFSQLCKLHDPPGRAYGKELDSMNLYAENLRVTIRSCFKHYLRSKLASDQITETVTPLLRHVQELLSPLETFPLFLDMLEMDPFMLKKARPAGIVDGPIYRGVVYPPSGIDPPWVSCSNSHGINLRGEPIELVISANSPIEEQKVRFKKSTGLRRQWFYLVHLQNLVLLNLIETAIHGYSIRDGEDVAIKLAILAAELHAFIEPMSPDYFAFSFSLAELQLRRSERPDGNTTGYGLTN